MKVLHLKVKYLLTLTRTFLINPFDVHIELPFQKEALLIQNINYLNIGFVSKWQHYLFFTSSSTLIHSLKVCLKLSKKKNLGKI